MNDYSVLMTMYRGDNPQFAKDSIESIINQTVKTNDFVIVCDGELSSELNVLLDDFSKKYSFINVFRLENNVGLGAALKYGVPLCKNELIARMDDDDIAHLNRCEKELERFSVNSSLDICGSFMNEFSDDPSVILRVKKVPISLGEIVRFSKRRNPLNHSTVMFKKSTILANGNYNEMRTNQDVDLWVRCINNGAIVENIPESLVDFRFDSSTYSRRKSWKNVRLMISIWRNFKKNKFCSLADYVSVIFVQISIFIMPNFLLKWCYSHLR